MKWSLTYLSSSTTSTASILTTGSSSTYIGPACEICLGLQPAERRGAQVNLKTSSLRFLLFMQVQETLQTQEQ